MMELPEVQVGQRIRDCPIQRYRLVNQSGTARYRGTGGSTNQGTARGTEAQVG